MTTPTPGERALAYLQRLDLTDDDTDPEVVRLAAVIRDAVAAERERIITAAEDYAEGIAIADDMDGQSDTSRAAADAVRDFARGLRARPS